MKIRRIQYDIEYSHILTFQNEYKSKIASVFKEPSLRYGIENEGTIDESIKLIFIDLSIAIHCSKGALRIMYEGDPKDLFKGGSPQWNMLTQILNSIKEINGFGNIVRNSIKAYAVKVFEDNQKPNEMKINTIEKSKFIKFSPFENLNEFAVIFESGNNEHNSKIHFGNFSNLDIEKFDLTPFDLNYNKDLFNKEGYIAEVTIKKNINSFSKSNFKDLINEIEKLIEKFIPNESA